MSKIKTESMLLYDYEKERLFMVCRVNNRGIVVSCSLEETIDNAETIIENLILTALNETDNFKPFAEIESMVEIVDPGTMRFMLDSRIKSQVVIYRKSDYYYELIMKFISNAVK